MTITRRSALLGSGLAALGLAGCSSADGGGAGDPITIGYMESWSDTVAMAHLLANRLEALGHEIEFENLSDAALLFTALANGDVDIYSSAWPDVTHAAYMEEYGEDIEDLVTYNSGAMNMLAVPEYTDIASITELAPDPARFEGRLVGIESGAGLTAAVEDSVMPAYGLEEGFEFLTSSTAAMLTELESAISEQEDIVVTLWRPFWANQTYPVKALEDPQLAFGEPETMHVLARAGFQEDFADAAEYIAGIALSDQEYESLENLLVNDYGDGEEAEAVAAWLEKNPDILPAVES
ncbi:glycine betaine ABC transporter substrate-binding protein [Brachybacterium sacelli]|uniref:Glycine betaine/proline transport system substrate-binding protein n=1 Tax=Brachybacterium sacelli TaxID=173364 RepID=A0ABS4X3R7_9MICO|nr:glycine betaine ABC transporter substrate-binding protein [Brachybacterium sacelli]MBP2383113.1 glycine betaine/proline transport system substrate-binding protein [Brachybacterium sacelli]